MLKKIEEHEHSLEMQYPMLKKLLHPDAKVVPIMVGILTNEQAILYGKLLGSLLDEDTVIVCSSDFCHWGEDFDYTPTQPSIPIAEFIKTLDF